MMTHHIRPLLRSLALGGLAAGCASQAGPDYRGEPLLRLEGTLVNTAMIPSADAEVILNFTINGAAPWPADFIAPIPVEGAFPSAFTVELYTPPPADLLFPNFGDTTTSVAFAHIYVEQTQAGVPVSALGALESRMLIYVSEAVPTDSPIAFRYGPLTAGYHLLEQTFPQPTADQLASCTQNLMATYDTCTAADATQVCTIIAGSFGTGPGPTWSELPADSQLAITLDGLPCGSYATSIL